MSEFQAAARDACKEGSFWCGCVGSVRLMTCSKCLTRSQATKAELLNGNMLEI